MALPGAKNMQQLPPIGVRLHFHLSYRWWTLVWCPESTVWWRLSTFSAFYNCSTSYSRVIPEPLEESYDMDAPFRAKNPVVFYFLDLDQLWISVLISIYCKMELLSWRWSVALIYRHRYRTQVTLCPLCPVTRIKLCGLWPDGSQVLIMIVVPGMGFFLWSWP